MIHFKLVTAFVKSFEQSLATVGLRERELKSPAFGPGLA
jgi:hypothetical protein